jgi:hypothetical protein
VVYKKIPGTINKNLTSISENAVLISGDKKFPLEPHLKSRGYKDKGQGIPKTIFS